MNIKTILTLCFISITSIAHANYQSFRGVWIATSWGGIDFPHNKITLSGDSSQINAQKTEITSILDSLQSCNINAIMFQVRGHGDAFYPSSYEPWSKAITGTRGKDPGYDPLAFIIHEAHIRNIELHAWINPYRISHYTPNSPSIRSNWIIGKGTASAFLDPGNHEVLKYTLNIINEIITLYDIDGIVFDDYFYKNMPKTSYARNETHRNAKNNPHQLSLPDWRRENINQLMKNVRQLIDSTNQDISFGISPFGIYSTDTQTVWNESFTQCDTIVPPAGIAGSDAHATMYCDPATWMKRGYIDYIAPQLYWPSLPSEPTYNERQDYTTLCNWWAQLASKYNCLFYSSNDVAFNGKGRRHNSPADLINQLIVNKDNTQGVIFYNATHFLNLRGSNTHFSSSTKGYHNLLASAEEWKTATQQPQTIDTVDTPTPPPPYNPFRHLPCAIFPTHKGVKIFTDKATHIKIYNHDNKLIYRDNTNKALEIKLHKGKYTIHLNDETHSIELI